MNHEALANEARQRRGATLARDARITNVRAGFWFVPSQSSPTGGYLVDTDKKSCTCPDHEFGAVTCKHMIAVELVNAARATHFCCRECGHTFRSDSARFGSEGCPECRGHDIKPVTEEK